MAQYPFLKQKHTSSHANKLINASHGSFGGHQKSHLNDYNNPYFPNSDANISMPDHLHASKSSMLSGQIAQKASKHDSVTSNHNQGVYTTKQRSHDDSRSHQSFDKQPSGSMKPGSAKVVRVIKPTQVNYASSQSQSLNSSVK